MITYSYKVRDVKYIIFIVWTLTRVVLLDKSSKCLCVTHRHTDSLCTVCLWCVISCQQPVDDHLLSPSSCCITHFPQQIESQSISITRFTQMTLGCISSESHLFCEVSAL